MTSRACARTFVACFGLVAVAAAQQSEPSAADLDAVRADLKAVVIRPGQSLWGSTDFTLRYPLERLLARPASPPPSAPDIPILSDVPLIGSLYRRRPQLGAGEAWLVENLPKQVGASLTVRFEETTVRRYDATQDATEVRREVVVTGPPSARAATERVLNELAAQRDRTVIVQMTVVAREDVNGAEPTERVERLDAHRIKLAMRSVQEESKRGALDILSAPTVAVRAGEAAEVSIANEVSYVGDFDVEIVDGALIMNPKVETLPEGLTLRVLSLLSPDATKVATELSLERTAVVRPVPAVEGRVGDVTLRIERPETATLRWSTGGLLEVAAGGGLRITGLRWTDPESRKLQSVELLLAVDVAADPPVRLARVFASGDDADMVIVDVRGDDAVKDAAVDDVLEVVAADEVRGTWRVERAADGLLVLRRHSGEAPSSGTTLRVRAK
ncbi:MAG TPA: hypothetical protein VEI02_15065 [Planctomycetota bacterium]|nr:hypothetical protein [Planctomycetota bacterium]